MEFRWEARIRRCEDRRPRRSAVAGGSRRMTRRGWERRTPGVGQGPRFYKCPLLSSERSGGTCAVGFSGLSGGHGTVGPGARGGATGRNRPRRGAEDPASGLRARARCAGSGGAHEPAPPALAGAGSGPRDRIGRDGSVTSRSAGVGPESAPGAGRGNRAVPRTHPSRPPLPHLTRCERPHHPRRGPRGRIRA